jgi:hypothetical protein
MLGLVAVRARPAREEDLYIMQTGWRFQLLLTNRCSSVKAEHNPGKPRGMELPERPPMLIW